MWAQPHGTTFLLVLILGVALYSAARGVDFGHHWDEPKIVDSLCGTIRQGRLLPGWYNYPSMCYDLALVCTIPDVAARVSGRLPRGHGSLMRQVRSRGFRLRLRLLFVLISLASTVWVYLFVLAYQQDRTEALVAASLLALSWEIGYHIRWVAPDAVLMQFGAMVLLLLGVAAKQARPFPWLAGAYVAAGMACGTKYPGVLLLVPVLAVSVRLTAHGMCASSRLRTLSALLTVFVLTYLAVSPGTLIDPVRFLRDILYEMHHYGAGHGCHTVQPGVPCLALMLQYLALVLFSHYELIAGFCFAAVVAGVFAVWRHDRQAAAILLPFPFAYIVYMSLQRVLIVRNLLVVAPFLAVLAARGLMFWQRTYLPRKPYCALLPIAAGVTLVVNLSWLTRAADSIANRGRLPLPAQAIQYIRHNPTTPFLLATALGKDLTAYLRTPDALPNIADHASAGAKLLFYSSEADSMRNRWPCNAPNQYELLPDGPYEVNFDYYPSWAGDRRIVVVPADRADRLGVATWHR